MSSPAKLPPVCLVLLAIAAIWLPIKIGQWGGVLLNQQDRHDGFLMWVACEEGTHGLLAVAVCLPLFWNRRRLPYLIIPFLLATAPDFDHVLTAKQQAQTMPAADQPRDFIDYAEMGTRDASAHSLVVTFIAAGVLFLLTRKLDWAWILAMARTSHIIRDAHDAGGLAIFYPNPTVYELGLWPYLYWHSALGAMTFGVMFVYEPVNAFLRQITSGAGLVAALAPRHTRPEWAEDAPVVPKSSSHQHSRRSSRSSSSRRHRHSGDQGEPRRHSGRGSHSHGRSRSSHSNPSDDR